jgi:hypothetical protein
MTLPRLSIPAGKVDLPDQSAARCLPSAKFRDHDGRIAPYLRTWMTQWAKTISIKVINHYRDIMTKA